MRLRTAVVLTALAELATAAAARAQEEGVEALVAEALEKNPDLAAARHAVAAAKAGPERSRALPDPMLSVLYTNDAWRPTLGEREMTTLGLMASQTLPWPGKRGLRAQLAEREAEIEEQRLARARLSLAAAVRRAHAALVLARGTLAVIAEREATARDVEGVARSRYAVGQGAQQDVLRAQVEVTRIEQLRAEQEAEAAVRLAELNRLLARPADASLETPSELPLAPETRPLDAVQAWAERTSPELAAAALSIERDRAFLELARRETQPDLTVQAAYMNRGGFDPMWQAGVGVTLPLWRKKNAASRAEAQARLEVSQSRRESLRLQLRYRNQERLARLAQTERVAGLYADGIVPQDRMSIESAIASYQAGRVPFVAVLDALTTLYDDRVALLGLGARHAQLRAGLDELALDGAPALATAATRAVDAAAGGPAAMQD